ncbi:MAG: endonuclease/exonuclease/phosphatase family protein, partial [Clostridia bacterium]|nr:endonuclease/exonuclease/phosphatase family protein [Clostridia bacterium]
VIPSKISTNLKAMAENLAETLGTSWKTEMKIVTDTAAEAGEYEILLGETNRPETATFKSKIGEGQCGYGVVGHKIVILGSEEVYTEKAVSIFLSLVVFSTRNTAIKYMDANHENIVDVEDMISVMSFNLRVGHSGSMQGSVSKLLKTYMPDLLGVQEADSEWMGALTGRMGKNGYAAVGIGRDSNGTGERTAIFYRKDKFELIDHKTMWLTDTPDEVSKVEGSESRRIVTVAIFKRLSDGKEFAYANTHLDNSTESVREVQMRYLDQHIKSFTDIPFMVTGDFNCTRSSTTYKIATEEFGYENCSILASNARNRANATFVAGGIIDYCFRSAGAPFDPYLYAVCTETKNGNVISDHYPLFFLIEMK